MSVAKKISLFIISVLALAGYCFGYISDSVDVGSLASLSKFAKPYSFLLVVLGVIILYTPHATWKRITLGIFFVGAFGVTVTDYNNQEIAKNVPALAATILGFVTMMTLPKMQLDRPFTWYGSQNL